MISLHFAVFIFFSSPKVRDSQLLLSEVIPGHLYMHLIPSGQPGFQRPAQAHTYSALVLVFKRSCWCFVFYFYQRGQASTSCLGSMYLASNQI
jgi:hypothetical protein